MDLLVNNAGINGYGPFAETGAGLLSQVLAVNVTALTMLTRAAVPGMLARGRGAVVKVASLLALARSLPPEGLPHRAVYGGTNAPVTWPTPTRSPRRSRCSPCACSSPRWCRSTPCCSRTCCAR
ncbi:SDR family NAD(P)-dependent oxidoreductase [Streptomyces sp. NPDC006743]|uniref:SDR family NAD(P)-dependent oxidoreductase n=1 Tax=Streptomyces sp. NPDC006743 TaxID=3154480 RepID=UPI003456CC04